MTRSPSSHRRSPPLPRAPALRSIAQDRSSGAGRLAARALRFLSRTVTGWSRRPPTDLASACRRVSEDLRATQPSMGVFLEWSLEWRQLSRAGPDAVRLRLLRRWTRSRTDQVHRETARLVRVVRARYPAAESVLTISRSDSVLRALTALPPHRRPRQVLVLESRPGGEGRFQARDLNRAGVRAKVVPDREGPGLAGTVDLVLVGADTIYSDGSVAHKVGTRRLALAAHHARTPVVVVSARSKAVRRRGPVVPLGPLFDRTPASAIFEYWTDAGRVRHGHWKAGSPWVRPEIRPRNRGRVPR